MISQKYSSVSSSEYLCREVTRVRLSQLFINEFIKKKEFKIPLHLALGHEAIAVAVSSVMKDNDLLLLPHRNIHYNLARETFLKPELEEYRLKKSGLGGGKLGSMNLTNPNRNIPYTSSILGNNFSIASGMALAKKVNTDNSVIMVVTGDGAIEEGSFYENLLFMKSNNLCVLIIVENNQWSLATSISERRCEIDLNHFCASMGIKYAKLSNNDVLEYRNQIQELRELSLKESSPICIEAECTTFGFRWTETETPPFKRLINYHHGEAFNKHLSELRDIPIMEETERDPLFVIKSKIGEEKLLTLSKEEYEKIFAEVGL